MGRIALRGVRAMGRHGADATERARAQPFDVEAIVDFDSESAQRSDELGETIDYAALHRRIVLVISSTSFALIERLGSALLDAIFEDARVTSAEVTVSKPAILGGATPTVTVVRRRGQ